MSVPRGVVLAARIAVLLGTAPRVGGGALSAQAVRGVLVDDETRVVVDAASVALLAPDSSEITRVLTDSLGNFFVPAPAGGAYHLRAQRVGYRTTISQLFEIPEADTLDVQFFVATEAHLLDPITVLVPRVRGRDVFDGRMARGRGVLLSPEAVDSLRPTRHAGQILSHAEQVRVRWGWGRREDGSTGPIPRVHSYLGSGCLYYAVDRRPVPGAFFSDAAQWGVWPLSDLEPNDIVAVEVYRHGTEVPPNVRDQLIARDAGERRLLREIERGQCGLVIFWTPDGW